MKKLIMFSAFAVLAIAVNAQSEIASVKKDKSTVKKEESAAKKEKKEEKKELKKMEGKEVSDQSKQAFINDFGNIPVSQWKRTSNFDEATFTKKGKAITAYYDADGTLVGTTSHKSFTDLPVKAQKYIDSKYPGYSKEDVIYFKDNELNESDMMLFESQFDDMDNYFVLLKKDNKELIEQVNLDGNVSFFKQIK